MTGGSNCGDTKLFIVLSVEFSFNTLWEEVVSEEDDGEKNNCLENGHAEDVLDHFLGNNVFLLSVWWSLKEIIFWSFSSKSKRSKGVHNHVYPKELDSSKW